MGTDLARSLGTYMGRQFVLVVEPDGRARGEIADILLADEIVVFCALDAYEAVNFILAGLSPRVLVFDGRRSLQEVNTFQNAASRNPDLGKTPVIIVTNLHRERGSADRTVASVESLVDAIRALPTS